jgi:ribonuclease HII
VTVAASPRGDSPLDPDLTREAALSESGFVRVAGVDEVGRGAWAGPLVAAAVVLPDAPVLQPTALAGVRDSKLLTAAQRDGAYEAILATACDAGVGWVNADEIDLLGLTAANELAMCRAVRALRFAPDHLLVDAVKLRSLDIPQRPVIRGDRVCLSIAAASVVAKVTRDRWLAGLGLDFPAYGFEQHRGYGVGEHQQAIATHGCLPIHRHSYAPLRAAAAP